MQNLLSSVSKKLQLKKPYCQDFLSLVFIINRVSKAPKSSNKLIFEKNRGIENTFIGGIFFMQNTLSVGYVLLI